MRWAELEWLFGCGVGLAMLAWISACDDSGDPSGNSTEKDGDAANLPGLAINDSLYSESTSTTAEWITAEWYTCETEESACGLPCEENDLWVAINETDFRNSRTCGACMAVTSGKEEVVVEVIENCGGACTEGEIELSRSAFDRLGNLDEGQVAVSWRLVPCDRSGPIAFSYEEDSDEWWAGIQVRNAVLPVDFLEIRYAGFWERLEMDGWNHFPVSGDLGTGPFDFRVTAIDGQQIVDEEVPYAPGETVPGSVQFHVP